MVIYEWKPFFKHLYQIERKFSACIHLKSNSTPLDPCKRYFMVLSPMEAIKNEETNQGQTQTHSTKCAHL